MFEDLLYVFPTPYPEYRTSVYQLWRYNHLGDTWEELHFDPSKPLYYGQLIVIANRLFLVANDRLPPLPEFEVSEVNISGMSLETLLVCSRDEISEDGDGYGTDTIGFGNSLMFISQTTPGRMKAFDLVTRTWDRQWPQNPLMDWDGEEEFCSWVGKDISLLLPGSLW